MDMKLKTILAIYSSMLVGLLGGIIIFGPVNLSIASGITSATIFLTILMMAFSGVMLEENHSCVFKSFIYFSIWPLWIGFLFFSRGYLPTISSIVFGLFGSLSWLLFFIIMTWAPRYNGEWWISRAWYDCKYVFMKSHEKHFRKVSKECLEKAEIARAKAESI